MSSHVAALLLLGLAAVNSKDYGGYLPEFLPHHLVHEGVAKLRESLSQPIPLTKFQEWNIGRIDQNSTQYFYLFMMFEAGPGVTATFSFDQFSVKNSSADNPLHMFLDFTTTNLAMNYSGPWRINYVTSPQYPRLIKTEKGTFASTAEFDNLHAYTVAMINYTSGAVTAGFMEYAASWWSKSNSEFTPALPNEYATSGASWDVLRDATDSSFGVHNIYSVNPVTILMAKAFIRPKFVSNWYWNTLVGYTSQLRQTLNVLFTIPIGLSYIEGSCYGFDTFFTLNLPESASLDIHFETPSKAVLKFDGLLFTIWGKVSPGGGAPSFPWKVKDVPMKMTYSFEISGRHPISVRGSSSERSNLTASAFDHVPGCPGFGRAVVYRLGYGFGSGTVGAAVSAVLSS